MERFVFFSFQTKIDIFSKDFKFSLRHYENNIFIVKNQHGKYASVKCCDFFYLKHKSESFSDPETKQRKKNRLNFKKSFHTNNNAKET